MKQCWGLVFFFLLVQGVAAQSPFFQPYYLGKKSDAIKVNKILQDKTGYLWFGTDKGLFKFDGISYRRFLGIDNLPDENVTALAQDSLGRVWAGFKNGKISIVEKNSITSFEPEEGLSKQPVSDLLFDRKGVLWFSTYNDGVYYYHNNRLYRLDDMDGMPDLYAYDLEEDEQGNIWVGTDGGVAVCSRKGTSVEIKVMNYSTGLPDNIVRKILRGKNNTMWLATEDAGLACVDPLTLKMKSKKKDPWTYGSIADLLVVDDWIWVATARGLATVDCDDHSYTLKIQSPDQVTALMNDAEGNIWMGSKTGVSRTLGKELQFSEPPEDSNMVAIAIGSDGDIWYSTSQGLFRLKKNAEKNMVTKPLAGTPYQQKNVISLFADSEGFIWAGLYGEGAIRINPQNNSIKVFDKELRNGSVLNISGKNKSVWLATLGGATEIKIDKNFAVKNYSQTDGLATDYIYQVFVDSHDRAWFATDRAGVDMLDASGIHHFSDNLVSKVVYGFAEDSLHHVYANVQNSGLFVFDEKKFVPFEKQNRLHNLNFNILSSTSQGQLLVAHDLGIDIFDPVKNKFHYFDEETGIRNKIANLNAVARDQQEGLFIGTDHGLMVYYKSESKRQDTPKPFIDAFEADDEPVDLDQSDRLHYDQNNIKIGFIAFWYQNPAAIAFAYQLENYDRDWITTRDYSATYSKLPPGEYVFRLKASDSNDFTTAEETEIHFVVKPPFWRTTWFYVLAGLAFSLVAYSIVRFRERKLIRDKQELETKVKERTEEIEAKSHEIVAQAEEIRGINENLESIVKERTSELERKNKALEEYAFINAHQLRAPVASILGLINLMQKLDLSEDEKIYMDHLQQSARKLDSVVSSITLAIERGDFTRPSSDDDDD